MIIDQSLTILLLVLPVISQIPPEIYNPPASQKVKGGGIAAFYCYATGQPAPSFTWKKNGKKLNYTDSRYLISDFQGGSLLRIEPVRKKWDEGEVECVAENAHGDPVSAKATLTIYKSRWYLSFEGGDGGGGGGGGGAPNDLYPLFSNND